jgi:hypothetical protein
MSSIVSTSLAPSRISRWQPRLARLSTGPGTAKTSRFCSIACRAVVSEPLRGAASTTIPGRKTEISLFLCEHRPARQRNDGLSPEELGTYRNERELILRPRAKRVIGVRRV